MYKRNAVISNPRVLCLGEILFDCLADQVGRSLEEVESWHRLRTSKCGLP